MSDGTVIDRKNYYVGETSNQLRDGYGVYFYANKFFRYEGEWLKGRKHGHGKLLMADGSYYEGEFKHGEIDGHGFRKWQHNGNSYSGEFFKGEVHGHGVMNYADGSQYQGEFYRNQRHGTGILKENNMNVYEGSWYHNKKHGQGVQTYANGDEYEGEWVEGCRHGQGELNCVDGTVYEGQWRADLFNGQGLMVHASGFQFEGIWINGRPEEEPVEIIANIPGSQKFLEVPQGKKFALQLQLLNSNSEPISGESGREFRISAGYRYAQSSKAGRSQSLLELIENIEAQPITTPFGYDVLPYPIVESVKEIEELDEMFFKRKQKHSPAGSKIFGSDAIQEMRESSSETQRPEESAPIEIADDHDASSTVSDSKYATSEINLEGAVDMADDDADMNSLRLLPPPAPQRSSNEGLFEFQDLLLPSAPPNYRPFLQEDEVSISETPTGSTSSIKRGPGISSVSSSSVRSDKSRRSKEGRATSAASSSSISISEGKGGKGKNKSDSEEKGAKIGKTSPRQKQKQLKQQKPPKLKSAGKRGADGKHSNASHTKINEEVINSVELPSSLFAREGDYVIIVEEVTNPPFLGSLLPPLFVLVKVSASKKAAKKATPGKKDRGSKKDRDES